MNYLELFRATLPETVLEVAALLVLAVDLGFLRKASLRRRHLVATVIGIAGCAATLWAVSVAPALVVSGQALPQEMLLAAGGSAGVAQCGLLVLTVLTLLPLIGSKFTRNPGEYVCLVLMAAAGGLLISAAQDLLVIFVGLELLSLSLYILTAFAKRSGNSAEAAMKYYLFGGMSTAFLLFGFSYLYGITGSTSLATIVQTLQSGSYIGGAPLIAIALVMIATGLGFKVAAVPFHFWAPDTYEGAPAPIAAFIASVSKVASFALLVSIGTALLPRVGVSGAAFGSTFPSHSILQSPWTLILSFLAVASMIVGNLAALAQISVRRLVAYSAIAHAGYILIGLAFFSGTGGGQAVLYYILTYGLTVTGAFVVIGVVEYASGSDTLDAFLGLHKRSPILAASLLVFFLSLAGIPPLVGFWAKFNLFASVLSVGAGAVPFSLVALAIAFSAVSLYYYLQVLKRAWVMPAVDDEPIRIHPIMLVTVGAMALAVVVLGCFPVLVQDWIARFY
jgi:NADH-quinone oxidoreductase subunit N